MSDVDAPNAHTLIAQDLRALTRTYGDMSRYDVFRSISVHVFPDGVEDPIALKTWLSR